MSAETDTESDSPESPKRHRGRIPQAAWPQILQRHRAGATLSAIAREFDCTPSAISYIVRKAEAAGVEPTTPPPAPAPAPEPPVAAAAPPRPIPATTTLSLPDRSEPRRAPLQPTNGQPPLAAPPPVSQAMAAPPPAPEAATRPAPADGSPRPSQPPPVDAVEARLRETARGCLVAYRGWRQTPGEVSVQALNDAVHDLRKVLARIEIDMSASRREEQALRPIPVPAHRAARPR